MTPSARTAVENMLSQKRATLSSIERQRQELLIEIRTLEGVVALLPEDANSGKGREVRQLAEKRSRRPTETWMKILGLASSQATQPFGYSEVLLAAELENMDIKPPTLRARMMDYVNSGILARVENGRFLISAEGAQLLASSLKDERGSAATTEPPADYGHEAELDGPQKVAQHPVATRESVGSNPTVSAPFRRDLLSTTSTGPTSSTPNPPWLR